MARSFASFSPGCHLAEQIVAANGALASASRLASGARRGRAWPFGIVEPNKIERHIVKTEQNTKGPRERRFGMWVSIILGTYILAGLGVVLFVPYEIRGDIFVPWFVILCGISSYKIWRVRRIRQEEQTR